MAAKNISGKEKTKHSQFLKFQLQSREGDVKHQKCHWYGVLCVRRFALSGELALKSLAVFPVPRSTPTVYKEHVFG